MCPSSGETTVFMWHLVLVILCGWLSGMQQLCAHHQEKHLCLCDTWYLLFCVDDCLVCSNYVPIIRRNNSVYVTLGTCYSVWKTVWYAATMCPSSGETTVFMWHLVLVILCGWLSGMQQLCAHHQEKQQCLYDTWYLLFCMDDCLVCSNYVPIIRRNNCVYVTLGTCYSVWMTVWYAATMCPSSGEATLFMWHLVFVILCGWLSDMQQLCAHHQEEQLCLCDTWYLLFCVDDCLVCSNYVPIIRRSNFVYGTLGICYSVWMTVWYAAYQTVIHTE